MVVADYFVSGIWKCNSIISDINLHRNTNNSVEPGYKTPLSDFTEILKRGEKAMAIRWDYTMGRWKYISLIELKFNGNLFSAFIDFSQSGFALENLINMASFFPLPNIAIPLVRRRKSIL